MLCCQDSLQVSADVPSRHRRQPVLWWRDSVTVRLKSTGRYDQGLLSLVDHKSRLRC
jgi:hypothetical protein